MPPPGWLAQAFELESIIAREARMRIFAWRENRPDWPAWQFQFTEPVLDVRLVPPGAIQRESGRFANQANNTPPPPPGPKKPPGYA